MARKPRQKSISGINFVYFKAAYGIKLFSDTEDYECFLRILSDALKKYSCTLFSYTLNPKEVYLLIKSSDDNTFSKFMRTLLSGYAVKYNRKYLRNGNITSDRFKSLPIESEDKCPDIAVFIHQCAKNEFSSKKEYFENKIELCDTEFILNKTGFYNFKAMHNEKALFEYIPKHSKKQSDEQLLKIVVKYTGENPKDIEKLSKSKRDEILRNLRTKEGLSIGELQRLTGISRGIITRAYNKNKTDNKLYPDTTDYKTRNDVITQKITEKKEEEIWLL